jgi:hypothetical protein
MGTGRRRARSGLARDRGERGAGVSGRRRAALVEADTRGGAQSGGVIEQAPEKAWGGPTAIAPRVLTQLSLDGAVARASNAGAWYTSRPTWTTTQMWWRQAVPDALAAQQGYADLVGRWLWSYGPGTVEDIAWWLGATKSVVRTALDDLRAQKVSLSDGSVGWLRNDASDSRVNAAHSEPAAPSETAAATGATTRESEPTIAGHTTTTSRRTGSNA